MRYCGREEALIIVNAQKQVQMIQMCVSVPPRQDVLMMIRQGVAKQDRVAVKNALQLAYQLQTPIVPWLQG